MKLKILLILFIIVSVLGTFIAFINNRRSQKETQPLTPMTTKVRLATTTGTRTYSVASVIAKEKGIFKKYNLDVTIQKVDKGLAKIITGENTDVAIAGVSTFLPAAIKNASIFWIGSVISDNPSVFVSKKNPQEIKKVATLLLGGENHLKSLEALKTLKIDSSEVTFQLMDNPQIHLQSLVAGTTDAVTVPQNTWIAFKEKKETSNSQIKVLVDSTENNTMQQPGAIIVNKSFFDKNKEAVNNFSKALIEANSWIRNNKDVSSEIVAKNLDIPDTQAKQLIDMYVDLLKENPFTPDSEKGYLLLTLVSQQLPQAKDYSIEKFINLNTSQSLQTSGFLEQHLTK